MAEKVNTGGLTSFQYPRGYKPPKDKELENRIDLAYEKYYKRKRRDNFIKLGIGIILLILLTLYFIIR